LLLGVDFAAAKDCGGYLHIVDGVTITRRIELVSGQRCNFRLANSSGPMANLVVTQRPAHGTASVSAPHRLSYVAARGYHGEDSFMYERHGVDSRNSSVNFSIRVLATIAK
jgi:hypothetical protein